MLADRVELHCVNTSTSSLLLVVLVSSHERCTSHKILKPLSKSFALNLFSVNKTDKPISISPGSSLLAVQTTRTHTCMEQHTAFRQLLVWLATPPIRPQHSISHRIRDKQLYIIRKINNLQIRITCSTRAPPRCRCRAFWLVKLSLVKGALAPGEHSRPGVSIHMRICVWVLCSASKEATVHRSAQIHCANKFSLVPRYSSPIPPWSTPLSAQHSMETYSHTRLTYIHSLNGVLKFLIRCTVAFAEKPLKPLQIQVLGLVNLTQFGCSQLNVLSPTCTAHTKARLRSTPKIPASLIYSGTLVLNDNVYIQQTDRK